MSDAEQKMNKKESAAYARGFRNGKKSVKDKTEAADFLKLLTEDVKDLAMKMIDASMSNPLLGIFVSIVSVDMLEQLKIIRPATAWGLYAAIGVMEGAGAAADVIKSFESIFGGAKGTTSLVQPSATTLVQGGKDLQALMAELGKK